VGKLARINAQKKKDGLPVENNGYQKTERLTRGEINSLAVEVAGTLLSRSLGSGVGGSKSNRLGDMLNFITRGF
jgi:hypothetical protein